MIGGPIPAIGRVGGRWDLVELGDVDGPELEVAVPPAVPHCEFEAAHAVMSRCTCVFPSVGRCLWIGLDLGTILISVFGSCDVGISVPLVLGTDVAALSEDDGRVNIMGLPFTVTLLERSPCAFGPAPFWYPSQMWEFGGARLRGQLLIDGCVSDR